MIELHIIFTRKEEVLISKKPYSSWQEIQDEYDHYMASVGPWDVTTAVSWLDEEYSTLIPSAHEQVDALMSSEQTSQILSFAKKN